MELGEADAGAPASGASVQVPGSPTSADITVVASAAPVAVRRVRGWTIIDEPSVQKQVRMSWQNASAAPRVGPGVSTLTGQQMTRWQ